MSLQETVSAERVHIAWFGLRNAGKSSLVNAVTGQDVSIVSEVRGTTTDPVRKTMELLPLGPVVIIDTPGLDDEGELGRLLVERTNRILAQTDIAVLAVDAAIGLTELDREILAEIILRKIPPMVGKMAIFETIQHIVYRQFLPTRKNRYLCTLHKKRFFQVLKILH